AHTPISALVLGGPYADVSFADRAHDPDGEEFACEDPLDGIVLAGVERNSDCVRVVRAVVESRDQGHRGAFGDHEPQPQLGGGSGVATVHVRQTSSCSGPTVRRGSVVPSHSLQRGTPRTMT